MAFLGVVLGSFAWAVVSRRSIVSVSGLLPTLTASQHARK